MPASSNLALPPAALCDAAIDGQPTADISFDDEAEPLADFRARLHALAREGSPDQVGHSHPIYPRTATAAELDRKVLQPPVWAVRGLIPQGAAIVAGKPKAGKSWLCLDLTLAVAAARPALGSLVAEPGPVLYLALEDTAYRLQSRLRAALGGIPAPEYLHFTTRWPRLPAGLDALGGWLDHHPGTRLVIVDTLAKLRGTATTSANAYADDYETIGALKQLADKQRVTILIVHHLRKAAIDDPLDAVSGSTGLTGAADTILVLARRRGAGVARLFATGRDLDEQDLTLAWQDQPAGWRIGGDDEALDLPPWCAEILTALRAAPDGLTPAQLAAETDRTANAARVALHRLAQLGRVARRDGRYHLADPTQPPEPLAA